MFNIFIEDVNDELNIRMLAANDSDDLFKIVDRSRDHLRQWLPWVDEMQTKTDALNFIKNGFQIYAAQTGMTLGVFYQKKLVGVVGYTYFDWRNKTTAVGYWLDKKAQGQGIMTRVVDYLIKFAFNELQLNRVEIRVANGNIKSKAIPKRLNFTYEGTLREAEWLYDQYVDHQVYSHLKSD